MFPKHRRNHVPENLYSLISRSNSSLYALARLAERDKYRQTYVPACKPPALLYIVFGSIRKNPLYVRLCF